MKCILQTNDLISTSEIENFENIKYEHQKQFIAIINRRNKNPDQRKRKLPDESCKSFTVSCVDSEEICFACLSVIAKNTLCVRYIESTFQGSQILHLTCLCQKRESFNFPWSGKLLQGYGELQNHHQYIVDISLPSLVESERQTKSIRTLEPVACSSELEAKIASQSEKFLENRYQLQAFSNENLADLLTLNGYEVSWKDREELLNACADIFTFGRLGKCKKCHDGSLVFSKHGYTCNGWKNEWMKCKHFEETPARSECKIPDYWKFVEFFQTFKPSVDHRAVRPKPEIEIQMEPSTTKRSLAVCRGIKAIVEQLEDTVDPKSMLGPKATVYRDGYNVSYSYVLVHLNSANKIDKFFKMQVLKDVFFGFGPLLSTASKFYVFKHWSSYPSFESNSSLEAFTSLESSTSEFEMVFKEKTGNDWNSTSKLKKLSGKFHLLKIEDNLSFFLHILPQFLQGKRFPTIFQTSESILQDPEDNQVNCCRASILGYFSCVLTFVDIENNKNSFCRLEISPGSELHSYQLTSTCGRIGAASSSSHIETFRSFDELMGKFESVFLEKTGNEWKSRSNFKPMPGKYFLNDFTSYSVNSNEVMKLLKFIKVVDKDLQLKPELLPLGRLSPQQLQTAMMTLFELEEATKNQSPRETLIGLSKKFFTLLPLDSKSKEIPVVDCREEVNKQHIKLHSIREFESSIGELELRYSQLDADIKVLDRTSGEFRMIEKYAMNTLVHEYKMNVLDIFKVKRRSEEDRFQPFSNFHNRMLLWHGSPTRNIASIIKQGLKITGISSGDMFGRGIYFADVISKSANYCKGEEGPGILLLCQVALGNIHDVLRSQKFTSPPATFNSIRGIGVTQPNFSSAHTRSDGVIVPLESPLMYSVNDLPITSRPTLKYNEYIVYNEAQIKLEYLVKFEKV
jgi:poly [ADP-ribose] polymerase 1